MSSVLRPINRLCQESGRQSTSTGFRLKITRVRHIAPAAGVLLRTMTRKTVLLTMLFVIVAAATLSASDAPADKAVRVESKNVCMINDRSMANEQIPVEVDGKTYYGCCPMCKERLAKEEASRYAIDPVSGNKVDKAKAVIGALPGAAVLYFESVENFQRYNAGARAKQ
jgi:YHS domain-containing protein